MIILIVIAFFVFLAVIITLSIFIVYHLKNYGIEGDVTRAAIGVFSVVTLLLVIVSLLLFFSIPWSSIISVDPLVV